MSTPETPKGETTPAPAEAAPAPAAPASITLVEDPTVAAIRSLRNLINIVLIGHIVLAASLALYLYREIQIAQKQINGYTRQIAAYQQFVEPKLNDFRSQLDAFSKLHPDFLPIYGKYFLNTNAAASVGVGEIPAFESQPPPKSKGGLVR